MKNLATRRVVAAVVAAVLGVLAAAGFVVVVENKEEPGGKRTTTVTIHVDGSDADRARDDVLKVPAVEVRRAERAELGDHEGLRTEAPVGAPLEQIDAAQQAADKFAADDQLPPVTPDAAPQQAGCRSRFVASHSSRRGVRPRLLVLHYTVSPNRPGWGDVDGVTALFARASFAASSNYVIDREANCNYIVRESDKAWTQAAANPFSISVEIINSGKEANLIDGPGLEQLGRILRDAGKRWEIPIRKGAVNGCAPTRSGIVTHQMLGACGGGHVDVSPYSFDAVLRAAGGGITGTDRVTCRKLNWWRSHGRPKGKAERNAVRRRKALQARGVMCLKSGPVRR